MKISLTGLRPGTHEFHFEELPAKWGLENHQDLRTLVHLTVQMEKGTAAIHVRNHIRTTGHFTCDRCLEEFDRALEDSGRVVFSSNEALAGPEDDVIHAYDANAHEIDLTADIRDLLLLSIPAKLLCRDDCRGLCAGCGAHLNFEKCRCETTHVEVRWQPLQKLLKQ